MHESVTKVCFRKKSSRELNVLHIILNHSTQAMQSHAAKFNDLAHSKVLLVVDKTLRLKTQLSDIKTDTLEFNQLRLKEKLTG